jgi:hypothetical protein
MSDSKDACISLVAFEKVAQDTASNTTGHFWNETFHVFKTWKVCVTADNQLPVTRAGWVNRGQTENFIEKPEALLPGR